TFGASTLGAKPIPNLTRFMGGLRRGLWTSAESRTGSSVGARWLGGGEVGDEADDVLREEVHGAVPHSWFLPIAGADQEAAEAAYLFVQRPNLARDGRGTAD